MLRYGLGVAILLLVFFASGSATARHIDGKLLNSSQPWLVVDRSDNEVYKCTWYGGTILFWEGDKVLLTKDSGFGSMVGLSGLSKGKCARVWIESL